MQIKVGVLPEDVLQASYAQLEGAEAHQWRFIRLPHPRTGLPSLFHISAGTEAQILEVQAVSPPNQRSWMVDQSVVSDGKMLMMTPIDPAFLLIPLLRRITPIGGPVNFRTSEDIFEECATRLKDEEGAADILEADVVAFLAMNGTESALNRICETKDVASSITVFRYSSEKALTYLRHKVDHLSKAPLTDISRSITRTIAKQGLFEDDKVELLKAARLKVSCDLISHYLSPELSSSLTACYQLSALEAYLTELHNQETQISMPAKGKKADAAAAPDKKRKAVKGSQGVEKLKKANVKGMSQLSSFFTKKT